MCVFDNMIALDGFCERYANLDAIMEPPGTVVCVECKQLLCEDKLTEKRRCKDRVSCAEYRAQADRAQTYEEEDDDEGISVAS